MFPGHCCVCLTFPAGFVAPCLPIKTHTLPSGAVPLLTLLDVARGRPESAVQQITNV